MKQRGYRRRNVSLFAGAREVYEAYEAYNARLRHGKWQHGFPSLATCGEAGIKAGASSLGTEQVRITVLDLAHTRITVQ